MCASSISFSLTRRYQCLLKAGKNKSSTLLPGPAHSPCAAKCARLFVKTDPIREQGAPANAIENTIVLKKKVQITFVTDTKRKTIIKKESPSETLETLKETSG